MYEADIFKTMQADITYYQAPGKIFVMGDLNRRTSVKLDYVEKRHVSCSSLTGVTALCP